MALGLSYETDNIFAKIIRGEIPCTKIYEDDALLSFMDLFPQSRGHALVIHKQAQATNLFDIESQSLSELIVGVQKIGTAMIAALNPDGVKTAQFNGASAGQTVFHLHFHLIPTYEDMSLTSHGKSGQADPAELDAIAASIRAKL